MPINVKGMGTFNIYLSLPGTTREAFEAYEEIFGATRDGLFTFKDTEEMGIPYDPQDADLIAHTALTLPNMTLMGSDYRKEPTPGTTMFICYFPTDRADADRVFAALSEGGTTIFPLEDQPWGNYNGRVIDRFGVGWDVMIP